MSVAPTLVPPAAWTVVCVIRASALPEILFIATTMPKLSPVAPNHASDSDVETLSIEATIAVSVVALTVSAPIAWTVLSAIHAFAPAPCSLPKASATSGEPMIASTVWNRMFCGAQPIVLKASVAAIEYSPDDVALTRIASTPAPLVARTVTWPLTRSAAVPIVPWVTWASAPPCTVFVAINPPAASEVPVPNLPPPTELTALSRWAVKVASAVASTRTVPAAAESVTPSR